MERNFEELEIDEYEEPKIADIEEVARHCISPGACCTGCKGITET